MWVEMLWIPAFEAVSQLPRSRTTKELKYINKNQIKPLFYKTYSHFYAIILV